MKHSKIALIAACIVGAAGVAAAADSIHSAHAGGDKHHRYMHGHHFGGEPPLARVIQRLDLTDEQRQSIHSLVESSKAQREAMREEHREAMKAAMTILPDDPSYPALIEKRKQLATAAIQQRSDLNVQMFALLTPEQKAQVPTLIEAMKARAKAWRGGERERENETHL